MENPHEEQQSALLSRIVANVVSCLYKTFQFITEINEIG
jgi:hypothetical protein